MNTTKIALQCDNDFSKYSIADTVLEMVNHTDSNGVLYIPQWPYDDMPYDEEGYFRCTMDWSDVADGIASEDAKVRLRRLCRLQELGAPKSVMDNEANLLLQALILNVFGKDVKLVEKEPSNDC